MGAVAHAALRGLQVVEQEVAAVAHSDGDAEEAAVLGAAVKELPGGAGGELAGLTGPRQGGVLQGQPHRSLCATVIHLRRSGERRSTETVITGSQAVITARQLGQRALIIPGCWMFAGLSHLGTKL